MSPNSPATGRVRPAAVVNEAIRALVARAAGRPWTPEERDEYEQMLKEWADAVRAEGMAAAA